MFRFYLWQKINKIIPINNFYWNTWKFHLKHMESSLDPLAIVSTELKARNKSVTLKKLSIINDNNEKISLF
jgi:hypothetical protein